MPHKKYFVFLFLICLAWAAKSQQIPLPKKIKNSFGISFLELNMPKNRNDIKSHMGLMGLHYSSKLNKNIYLGTGIYAAMTGDQGGLFTLDAFVGLQKKISPNLIFDTQFHFGGGGGYRHLINDGAFIHSLTGLMLNSSWANFGLHYSYFNFYTGLVRDHGLQLSVSIPFDFYAVENVKPNQILPKTILEDWPQKQKSYSFSVTNDFLFPINLSKSENGTLMRGKVLQSLGFVYQKNLSKKHFIFFQTDAIYKGMRAGFMDVFIGMGIYPFSYKQFKTFFKLGFGGSGGRIAKEGGATVYPTTGLYWQINPKWAASLHGGYYRALDGNFEAYNAGIGLTYQMKYDLNEVKKSTIRTKGFSVGLSSQHFFKVNKYDPPFVFEPDSNNKQNLENTNNNVYRYQKDLDCISLNGSYLLNNTFTIKGEAAFAYGGASGGYAHGLVGIGMNSSYFIKDKVNLNAHLLLGAGGGAGVDTGEGLLAKWDINLNYSLKRNLNITVGTGELIMISDMYKNKFIQAGVTYQFNVLNN